jgi:hypothetical protein
MYSFDIPEKQYHKFAKFIDRSDFVNEMYDRSLRAVFPLIISENMTSEFNYQTSFWSDELDEIFYQNASYNWTEADMVYLQIN